MLGKSENIKAQIFRELFDPYQGRYTVKSKTPLFEEPMWRTVDGRLQDGTIERAITEELVAGWFLTHTPHVLGVDVDDHQGRAWQRGQPSLFLVQVLDQAVGRLHLRPGLLVQSPRGLHGYWFLEQRLPAELLYQLASAALRGLPVEIKPTPSTALRIPSERRIYAPDTLQPLRIPFEQLAGLVRPVHPALMFFEEYLPETVRTTLRERRQRVRILKHGRKIDQVECAVLPIESGRSNSAFLALVNVYRCAGLTEEEAAGRFVMAMAQSPRYQGELTNGRRLMQRIHAEYRKNAGYHPEPRAVQLDWLTEDLADRIATIQPWARQRQKPVRRFVAELLYWCSWHDEILKDRGQAALFDYLYPYYRKNRKEGYYPLPFTALRRWSRRYNEFTRWLREIGFLDPAPYPYVPGVGICRYYQVKK